MGNSCTAVGLANYVVDYANNHMGVNASGISYNQLCNIMYYLQVYYYRRFGSWIFTDECFVATEYRPELRGVRKAYNAYNGSTKIAQPAGPLASFPDHTKQQFVDDGIGYLIGCASKDLQFYDMLYDEEMPWLVISSCYDGQEEEMPIPYELMRESFQHGLSSTWGWQQSQLQGRSAKNPAKAHNVTASARKLFEGLYDGLLDDVAVADSLASFKKYFNNHNAPIADLLIVGIVLSAAKDGTGGQDSSPAADRLWCLQTNMTRINLRALKEYASGSGQISVRVYNLIELVDDRVQHEVRNIRSMRIDGRYISQEARNQIAISAKKVEDRAADEIARIDKAAADEIARIDEATADVRDAATRDTIDVVAALGVFSALVLTINVGGEFISQAVGALKGGTRFVGAVCVVAFVGLVVLNLAWLLFTFLDRLIRGRDAAAGVGPWALIPPQALVAADVALGLVAFVSLGVAMG